MTRSATILRRVDAYTLRVFNPPLTRAYQHTRAARDDELNPQAGVDVVKTIAALLTTEHRRIRDGMDPVFVLRETERVRNGVTACLEQLQADCPQAVRTLRRRGWSFARIAAETNLSTRRVAELARVTHRRTQEPSA